MTPTNSYEKWLENVHQQRLIELYNEIHQLTLAICSKCDPPYNCCQIQGCEQADAWASHVYKVKLQKEEVMPHAVGQLSHPTTQVSAGDVSAETRLPFLTDKGCTVPLHMRPICSTWLCPEGRKTAPARFKELREEITKLEARKFMIIEKNR